MLIAKPVIIIIAVVSLATHAVGWQRSIRSTNSSESADWSSEGDEVMSNEGSSGWRTHRDNQLLIEQGKNACCPSTLEMVEPLGGINLDGMLVELFSEGENKQRFYELSCSKGFEGKPCRFVDRRLHNQSVCVQKYSYTYAIIKEPSPRGSNLSRQNHFTSFPAAGTNWVLDYIRVRSGCACELMPKAKRKRNSHKRRKGRRKSSENFND